MRVAIARPMSGTPAASSSNSGSPIRMARIPIRQGPAFRTWTRYTYDRVGRVIQEEDTQLRLTAYAYNSRDLVTQTTLPDPDGSGSATSPVLSVSYDNAGRAVSQTDPLESGHGGHV